MVRIAITGGIACGKSLVGQYMREMGIPVCEADELGHAVLEKGETAYAAVIQAFGSSIVRGDGRIDRAELGRIVFSDPRRRAELNALTHPEILKRLRGWMDEQRKGGAAHAAAVIPLLFEVCDRTEWGRVVCVAAPEADQVHRLGERGLTESEAQARIRAQLTQAEKMERSDFVVFNCGGKDMLKEQTARVVRSIRGEGL
jgi:dephospho-CoA kinase